MRKKLILASIVIFLIIMIVIGCFSLTSYLQHSTIPKALKLDESSVQTFDFADGQVAVVDFNTHIQAYYMQKDWLGWHTRLESSPVMKNSQHYSQLFSHFYVDGSTFLYGYFPSTHIKEVSLKLDQYYNSAVEFRCAIPASRIWFFPVSTELSSIQAEQLSIILDNGQQIRYPFEGLTNS